MNPLRLARLRNFAVKFNDPNPKCEDKCENAKKTILLLGNHHNDEIDITKVIIMCMKCGQSMWHIPEKKPTQKPEGENDEQK